VDIGTRAGYLLTDWNGKNILNPCINLWHLWRTVGWDSIAFWHCWLD